MDFAKKNLYDASEDPEYSRPVIDEQKWADRQTIDGQKIPFQYLHGHFEGTDVKFLFCFPKKEAYEWRFFQHLSPFPGPDEELASLSKIKRG